MWRIYQGFNQITSGVKQRGKEQSNLGSNWSLALHPVVKIKKKTIRLMLSCGKGKLIISPSSAREKETPNDGGAFALTPPPRRVCGWNINTLKALLGSQGSRLVGMPLSQHYVLRCLL